MSSVLVTGAGGFIGRYCVKELIALGYDVHATTTRPQPEGAKNIRWHRVDLLAADDLGRLVTSIRAQSLMHLAWIATPPVFWTSPLNLEWVSASMRLVEAFAQSGGSRVVVNGSCAEYAAAQTGPCIEDVTPIEPLTPYGKAKAALHSEIQKYAQQTGLSLGWGRSFFAYGPQEPPVKVISTIIRNLQSGQATSFREPDRLLDYIYVADAGRALAALLHGGFQGAVNIGTGAPATLADIESIAAKLVGKHPKAVVSPSSERCASRQANDVYADTSRLRERVGFSCEYTLEQGIRNMVDASLPSGAQTK